MLKWLFFKYNVIIMAKHRAALYSYEFSSEHNVTK